MGFRSCSQHIFMNLSYFFMLTMILSSCINSTQREINESAISPLMSNDSSYSKIETVFQKRGITGCFILYDVQNDLHLFYNQPRTVQQFLPAFTYKIPNSLIALECGVIRDENEIIPWDSVERFVSAWNKDHNLRTGIKYSVVWFYQEFARRIGESRMQSWVLQLKRYSNRTIQVFRALMPTEGGKDSGPFINKMDFFFFGHFQGVSGCR